MHPSSAGSWYNSPSTQCTTLNSSPTQNEKLIVKDVVVLIDREQGGQAHLAKNGLNLHAAFKLSKLLEVLVKHGKVG